MHIQRFMRLAIVLSLASGILPAQSSKTNAPADPGNVFRTETRLVIVDTVVTDKKGTYVRDLTVKNFRVWEDKTEQTLKTFSFEGAPSQVPQKQYVVFFFDDTSMSSVDQTLGRQAAAKFVAANFGPNHMMAVADFGGALRMTQNLTDDPELLSKALQGAQQSLASRKGTGDDVGRSMLAEMRSLARNLSSLPGRKALILFT